MARLGGHRTLMGRAGDEEGLVWHSEASNWAIVLILYNEGRNEAVLNIEASASVRDIAPGLSAYITSYCCAEM